MTVHVAGHTIEVVAQPSFLYVLVEIFGVKHFRKTVVVVVPNPINCKIIIGDGDGRSDVTGSGGLVEFIIAILFSLPVYQ